MASQLPCYSAYMHIWRTSSKGWHAKLSDSASMHVSSSAHTWHMKGAHGSHNRMCILTYCSLSQHSPVLDIQRIHSRSATKEALACSCRQHRQNASLFCTNCSQSAVSRAAGALKIPSSIKHGWCSKSSRAPGLVLPKFVEWLATKESMVSS